MKTSIIITGLALMIPAVPAQAGNYLSGKILKDTLSGRSLTWYDGSKSNYGSDGTYIFLGKARVSGSWDVRGSWVCVSFATGKEECARYYYRHGRLYAQNAAGRRFRAY